jgi:hypothetical protein
LQDHIPQESSAPSEREAQTADSKENIDEQDVIGEEQEQDEEQDDGVEQEDGTYVEHTDNLLSTPAKLVATVEVGETTETDAPVAVDDEYTEYSEYTDHDELDKGEYGEIPVNADNQQGVASIVLHGRSETLHSSDSAGIESATPHLLEPVPDLTGGFCMLQYEVSNNQGYCIST